MIGQLLTLSDALDVSEYGGKARSLARMLRATLSTPQGFAISSEAVGAIVAGHRQTVRALLEAYAKFGGMVAVRSSAVDEDSEETSFAGQHATKLGVTGSEALLAAIFEVAYSAERDGALAYRTKMGLSARSAKVAIVVQRQLAPTCAGVLFTCNPVNGADERIIEAAWGLGEVVVGSVITPDHYRITRGGTVVEKFAGNKSVSLHPLPGGGVERRQLGTADAGRLCLDDNLLTKLDQLAGDCENVFVGPLDIEWAVEGMDLFLLQCRPITTIAKSPIGAASV